MKQTVSGSLFILEFNKLDSSFIKTVAFDGKTEILSVVLQNDNTYNYQKVPFETFIEFSSAASPGSFYNNNIKNKFSHLNLTKMAEKKGNQPNRINKASKDKRFIKMSIDVSKLKREWFYISKDKETDEIKGVYAKLTLSMLPDGEVDKYGQLGFIVQDVPQEISKAEMDKPKNERTRGEILGNAEELEWAREETKLTAVTDIDSEEADDILDNLPF
jgi:hypothetical protein